MNYSKFATVANNSNNRIFRETDDPHRTCFMRDRDRIIHSTAFRRLKYKTQVFVYHEGDYYRTRLSHSIEVSQLARSISKIFLVNDDLAEAIALAHDLGHTPFGHAGEDALNEKLKSKGGYNHNFQTIKILTFLEKRYIDFDGLNLTWETLDGILKHNGSLKNHDIPSFINILVKSFKGDLSLNASIEGQIASVADDIAYNNNDIDDGLHAKLFDLEELESLTIIKNNLKKIKFKKIKKDEIRIKHELVRLCIKDMLNDLANATKFKLDKHQPKCSQDIKEIDEKIVTFSDEMKQNEKELRLFLKKKMYEHAAVKTMTFKAKKIISELFDLFEAEPQLLPENWRKFNFSSDLHDSISNYISSLTDKKAITIHNRFFNLYSF
tara:strand:- start:1318 stop:2460 length:1143 start_codon:yes stop_codon:yes gene_type:complete